MLDVRIDDDLEGRLGALARLEGRSERDIVVDAVRRYVERHDPVFLAEARRQSLAAAARGWSKDDEAWERLAAGWDEADGDDPRRFAG